MSHIRNLRPHRRFCRLLAILLLVCLPSSALADDDVDEPRAVVSSALDAATAAAMEAMENDDSDDEIAADELRAIVDEHMERHLFDFDDIGRGGIATGAIFAAVGPDGLIMADGYGYADYAETPVDPATTAFNIGSATTSVSAIPVHQAIDAGLIGIDDDITTYLDDFELDDGFDEAIAIRHLLDHTAGFRESTTAIRTPSPDERVDLGDTLREHFPQRTRKPGREYQHSHHGIALAGYIAERAQDAPFVELLANLFDSLGMDQTFSVAHTVPTQNIATGHGLVAGELQPHRRRGVRLSPVDGVHTTAADAASLLQFLVHGDPDVLSDDQHRKMLETSFRPHPEVAGVTPGFKEILRGDQRWLLAVGETPDGFSSLIAFSPTYEFGVFVAYNSGLGAVVRFDLLDEILDEVFPVDPLDEFHPARAAETRVSEFTGTYQLNRTVDAGFTKPLSQLMSVRAEVEPFEAENDPDSSEQLATHNVQISHPLSPEPTYWVPVADDPDLWRHVDGHATLVVHRDEQNRITGFSHDHPDLMTFHRPSWHQNPSLIGGLLAGFLMLFLAASFIWPIQAIRRRFGKKSEDDSEPGERRRWLAVLYSVLAVVFFIGYGVVVGRHVFGVPDWATFLFLIPFVLIALAPLLVYCAVQNYRERRETPLGRLFYAIVAAAAALLPVLFYWWDLLGFQW